MVLSHAEREALCLDEDRRGEPEDEPSAPPSAAASPEAPAAPPPMTDQPDYIKELKQLAELKDAGIITEEEFEAKKKQLLGL